MMLAGKYAPARYSIEERARVATRDKHTLSLNACRVRPLDCDAVCGVLARQTKRARQASGPNLLQPNEADADERMSPVELGPKRLGKDALDHGRVGPEINEQPSLDHAFNHWNAHRPEPAIGRFTRTLML